MFNQLSVETISMPTFENHRIGQRASSLGNALAPCTDAAVAAAGRQPPLTRPSNRTLFRLDAATIAKIASYLTAQDRQHLRRTARFLKSALAANAEIDRIASRLRRVVSISSLLRAAADIETLPPAKRTRLLTELASRIKSFPQVLAVPACSHMVTMLDLMPPRDRLQPLAVLAAIEDHGACAGPIDPFRTSEAAADMRARILLDAVNRLPRKRRAGPLAALIKHHVTSVTLTEDFIRATRAYPAAQRGPLLAALAGCSELANAAGSRKKDLWYCLLEETAKMPEANRAEALTALAQVEGLWPWAEYQRMAATASPENQAAIYAGLAAAVARRGTDVVEPYFRQLLEQSSKLPPRLRDRVLAKLADYVKDDTVAPRWHGFLDYIERNVPGDRRLPILLNMVPECFPAISERNVVGDIITASSALPADHRDPLLARCAESAFPREGMQHLDALFDATKTMPAAFRHQTLAALAGQRYWLFEGRRDDSRIIAILAMIGELDSQHRWKTVCNLVRSVFDNNASGSGALSRWVGKESWRAIECAADKLAPEHLAKLIMTLVGHIRHCESEAWQWAYKATMKLPLEERPEVLLRFGYLKKPDKIKAMGWRSIRQIIDASAEIPRLYRAAPLFGAEAMLQYFKFAKLPVYLYGRISLGRKKNELPEEDKYWKAVAWPQ